MPININDLSRLGALKQHLTEGNVSSAAIEAIEFALRNGSSFGGAADLRTLNITENELATIAPILDFGPRVTFVPNIKTVRYRIEPSEDEASLFGYQLSVGMPGVSGIATEESFPIGEELVVIVDFDLAKLPSDGTVVLRAKRPDGGYTELGTGAEGAPVSDRIEVEVGALADARINVVVAPIVAPRDRQVVPNYSVRGRLIARDGTGKLDGYQIVLFAASTPNPTDADYVAVATAVTESNGYFVTAALLFADPAEIDHVTGAKARVSSSDVLVDLPIRLVTTDGDPSKSRIPERLILVLNPDATGAADEERDECGCNDLNFEHKKVLEEYSYYAVVRTSEPAIIADTIEDEPEINLQDIYGVPGFVPLSVFKRYHEIQARQPVAAAAKAMLFDQPEATATRTSRDFTDVVPASAVSTVAGDPRRAPVAINIELLNRLVAEHRAQIVIKGNAKPRFRGRTHLGPANQIDWDDTPTIFQAASIAHGHLLHFKQEWAPDGYSLGDIVYSLPLAPGQKKQIAVLDWERRESAAKSQQLDYEEALSNTLVRDRDINEVVAGTLTENIRANSKATSRGIGFGLGAAVLGAGKFGGLLGISGGASSAGSNASSTARRDITSSSLQSITDRTQQAASMVRSQRATVVQTVSQGERVQATAESVANYNHCHAITIQYFEVLRHFAVRNRLAGVQECLFVPLQMTRFSVAKCLRWRSSLEAALFKPELARGFDAIARIQNERESASENFYDSIGYPRSRYGEQPIKSFNGELFFEFFFFNTKETKVDEAVATFFSLFGISLSDLRDRQITDDELAERVGPRTIERLLDAFVVRTEQGIDLKLDLTLNSRFRQSVPLRVSVRSSAQTPQLPRDSFEALIVALDPAKLPAGVTADMPQFTQYMKVRLTSGHLRYRSQSLAETLFSGRIDNDIFAGLDGARLYTPLNAAELRNPRGEDVEAANNLIHHLNENLEYYNARLFMDFTPERRFMLLDGMIAPGKANGRSVASVVENRVIGIAGNSLIMPVAAGYQLDPTIDEKFQMFDQYYEDPPEAMRISMPTKGVYAEAVMGQCNSCEEKDDTRFWRWEESPVPDSPNTQILPLNTGTRRTDPGSLEPKDLPNPVVNIQNAPNLPDPTGIGEVLSALGKGDSFRDLTGLNQNQMNAIAAYQKSIDTAAAFGKEAAGLAKTAAMLDVIKNAKSSGALTKEQAQEKSGKVLDEATPPTFEKKVERAQMQLDLMKNAFDGGAIDAEQLKSLSEGALRETIPDSAGSLTPTDLSRITREANSSMTDVQYDAVKGEMSVKPFKGLGVEVQLANYSNRAKLNALANWKALLLYKVPQSIEAELATRSMAVQYAYKENFANDLNFDMYRVRIQKFPTIDGTLTTPETLAKYVRLHINDFSDVPFTPYDMGSDAQKWASDDPIGAVMRIDIPGPDNAAVVVSATGPRGWRFSTITAPDTGVHPVSGHREFFVGRDSGDGHWYLVIKGLDMSSTFGLPFVGAIAYWRGDALWEEWTENLFDMINANGGEATKREKLSEQIDWQLVHREYKEYLEMTFGPGAGGPGSTGLLDFDLF